MKKPKIAIVTSYLDGRPYHMKHSGYEQLVHYVPTTKVLFTLNYSRMSRIYSLLKFFKLIPSYYYSFKFEAKSIGNYDIIHHLYPESTYLLTGLKNSKFKSKVFLTLHKPADIEKSIMPFYWKKLLDKTNIIVLSQRQYDFFAEEFPTSRLFLIPHGVDVDYYKPKNIEKSNIILSVGDHMRDHDTLLKAMEIVNKKYPKLKLITVSYGFKTSSDKVNVTTYNNISDQKLEHLYHESLFQVLSLKDFTASNAVLEAFACGLPCVITDLPDVKFCTNNKGVVYYKRANYKQLANQIIMLYEKPNLRKKLSKQARSRAEQLSWQKISDKVKEAYMKVINDQ